MAWIMPERVLGVTLIQTKNATFLECSRERKHRKAT